MDTIKVESGNVRMIAHRGLSGLERENTATAFVAAGNRSYFGIETDIHVTADGKFVVIHDDNTERVSGGAVNINVEESTSRELREIILTDIDGSRSRQDIRIPYLADYISICKKYEKVCVLELKNEFSETDIERLLAEIRELGYFESVIFISFIVSNCIAIRRLSPDANIQLLGDLSFEEDPEKIINTAYENKLDLDILHTLLTREIVEKIHSLGMKLNCWTCDDPDRARELIDMGVDYITSNILE